MSFLLTLLILFSTIARAESCGPYLIGPDDQNGGLISYLEALLDSGTLKEIDLEKFASALEQGQLDNPVGTQSTALRIHARELDDYLAGGKIDSAFLLAWANSRLKRDARIKTERAHVADIVLSRQMKFIRVDLPPPLAYAIEVMDTPVTQKMWEDLMGKNPAHFKSDGRTVVDNPVESVTWWSAVEFANRLSDKMNLPPVYDFDGLTFKNDAADGMRTLVFFSTFEAIGKLENRNPQIVDGYRLPTIAEWEAIAREHQIPRGQIESYAWFDQNSAEGVQPVGDLLPVRFPGGPLFDFFGNVMEWTDSIEVSQSAPAQVEVSSMGGGWLSPASELSNGRRERLMHYGKSDIGFRLVRTLR